MPTTKYFASAKYDETVKFVAQALMFGMLLAAAKLGDVVFKKLNGHPRKVDSLTELAKKYSEQQGRLDAATARLDDLQGRLQELVGPDSPASVPVDDMVEDVPEMVLEPIHDARVVNPYDVRQHKSLVFKGFLFGDRTAEAVTDDINTLRLVIFVLVFFMWYRW